MNRESPTINAQILPRAGLDILSREEITRLRDASKGGLHELLRRCTLAVLTTGAESDDPRAAQVRYPDYDIEVLQLDTEPDGTVVPLRITGNLIDGTLAFGLDCVTIAQDGGAEPRRRHGHADRPVGTRGRKKRDRIPHRGEHLRLQIGEVLLHPNGRDPLRQRRVGR